MQLSVNCHPASKTYECVNNRSFLHWNNSGDSFCQCYKMYVTAVMTNSPCRRICCNVSFLYLSLLFLFFTTELAIAVSPCGPNVNIIFYLPVMSMLMLSYSSASLSEPNCTSCPGYCFPKRMKKLLLKANS